MRGTDEKHALITGITGQIGSYLAEYLLSLGYSVHGLLRRTSTSSTSRIDHIRDSLQLHYGDICDPASLIRLLDRVQPAEIYNLAAQSHVKVSFEAPCSTNDATGTGFLNLLEAAQFVCPRARIYQASSSEQFGNAASTDFPISESTTFRPASPYACSKQFAHNLARVYRESFGMFVACGIVFNTESPRRGVNFVTRKITQAVAKMAIDPQAPPVKLGNLDATRDWMHASDTVRGMHAILQQREPEDFVLATGRETSVRQFLQMAVSAAESSVLLNWRGKFKYDHAAVGYSVPGSMFPIGRVVATIDPYHHRPCDVMRLRGYASKAHDKLDWKPEITLEELVAEMVAADLAAAKREKMLQQN